MRKLFSALLCSSMLLTGTGLPVFAQEQATPVSDEVSIVHQGKIGTADWTIDSTGLLTIGVGEFTNNNEYYQWPWAEFRDSITRIDGSAEFTVTGSLYGCFRSNVFWTGPDPIESIDLSGWNTSSVTSLQDMFYGCNSLKELDLSSWDTSNVTNMVGTFGSCSALTSLNIGNWDTSSVTLMGNFIEGGMFTGCSSLTSLDIGSWNMSSVTKLDSMFANCTSLKALDIGSWDVSSVTSMLSLFDGCSSLISIDLRSWNTANVEDMRRVFSGCSSLPALEINSWNTSKVQSMYGLFSDCKSLTELDLGSWDTSKVTRMHGIQGVVPGPNGGGIFFGCENLKSLDISSWDTSAEEPFDIPDYLQTEEYLRIMSIFGDCDKLENIRYNQKAINVLEDLPDTAGWYQDGIGPFSIKELPVLANGKTALLTRSENKPDLPQETDLSKAVISGLKASYEETGSAITPKPKVELEGKTLTEGTHYTLSYSNNTAPGKATITITGIGSFKGTKSVTFTITEKKKPTFPKPPVPGDSKPQTPSQPKPPVSNNPKPSAPTEPTKPADAEIAIMHRLYNPNSGEHFYTSNDVEKNHLVSVGWKYEGTGWKAPKKSAIPVYRLYNPNAGDHHYTLDVKEKNALVKLGWKDEGIGWYSDEAKGVPLYRQYNPNAKAGSHNYTTNKNENDSLVKLGWKAEGIGWYGLNKDDDFE